MSEKTEQPTSKKIRQSREEGQVAHSKDFTQTVLILAIFGYILGRAESIFKAFGEMVLMPLSVLKLPFEAAADTVISQLFNEAVWALLPFLLIIIGLGLFVEMAQTGMLFAFKAMMPSAKKLNIASNLKNIFAVKNLIELLKSLLKIAFLTLLVINLLRDALPVMTSLPQGGLEGVGAAAGILLKNLLINIAIAYTIIAAADFAYQRYSYRKGLMMSKDEVKREYKEMEGSAEIKQQRKQLHQELMNSGAVERTKKSSVLITNPTHLAIAVLYEKDETPLPVVLAKGEGFLAEQMVKAAREAGVPILQNIPLAHSLMGSAVIDQYIPADLVEPVAEVLRLVRELGNEPA